MGYVSDAQRKAVHASKADGGKGNPNKMKITKSSALKKYLQLVKPLLNVNLKYGLVLMLLVGA